jgi:predicted O-methyltransferase YrrM
MDKYQDILMQMQAYAAETNIPIINHAGAELLCATVKKHKPVHVLEIGTAIGYSALLMAVHMPPCGCITTIELNPVRAQLAQGYLKQAGLSGRVNILVGDGGEILRQIEDHFDMVFIDAAKGQYLDYLFTIMDKLLPNGVILADNVLFRGWVNGELKPPRRFRTIIKRLRAYLDFVVHDPRFSTTVHNVGDGIAISIYRGAVGNEKT